MITDLTFDNVSQPQFNVVLYKSCHGRGNVLFTAIETLTKTTEPLVSSPVLARGTAQVYHVTKPLTKQGWVVRDKGDGGSLYPVCRKEHGKPRSAESKRLGKA